MNVSHQRININILLVILFALSSGCSVVHQATQMKNLANCDFRIESAQNLNLAGVYVENIRTWSDLSLLDAQKLLVAMAGSSVPLSMTLNIQAQNPNPDPAGMYKLEWILFIDDIQMAQGEFNQQVTIPGNGGMATIPVQLTFDLKQVLSGRSGKAIINFGLNLAGVGNTPTRIKARIKPSIMIGQTPLAYPGYITIKTEFGAN